MKRLTALLALTLLVGFPALAQDVIKVGVIAPFTGPFADYGKQFEAGVKAFQKVKGDTVAGKKVQVVIKDTGGPSPEVAKRLAQELVVQEKVDFLAGFGLTPEALAVADIATEAKKPMVIFNAATSIITTKSPYIARTSMTLPQISAPMGTWAAKNGIKKVVTLVADYGPGNDAEARSRRRSRPPAAPCRSRSARRCRIPISARSSSASRMRSPMRSSSSCLRARKASRS
jgi:branched-chain amino acid transport system substrate-binding protein